MADSKKATIDFATVTKILVGLMLVFMGIAGLVNTRGTEFTRPLFRFLDEDAFIIIVSILVALSGIGLLADQFIPGMPKMVGRISGIVAVVFWVLIIIFRDITQLDDIEFIEFVQNISVDLIILIEVVQSTVLSKK